MRHLRETRARLPATAAASCVATSCRATAKAGSGAPAGPAIDRDGSLFVASGNSESRGNYDQGNSVIQLDADLNTVDTFAPENWLELNASDVDFGSVSPVLLGNGRVFQVGNEGVGYVLDAAHLRGIGGDLHREKVCGGGVFGGVAHDGNVVLVPCSGELRALAINDRSRWCGPRQ